MAVSISDLLNLEVFQDFKLVAGKKGLDRVITSTEILDFEFMDEGLAYRERGFIGNSLVLSSLLFAKDKPELILKAVKQLISQNVQALAYKPVFFEDLPADALAYAEKMEFPVLKFGHDEYFEDIIFSIRSLVERDDVLGQTEPLIGEMLRREFTEEEAEEAHERINPLLRPMVAAVCVRDRDLRGVQISAKIRRSRPDEKLRSKTFVGKYEDLIVIVLSQDENQPSRFKTLLEDVSIVYGLVDRDLTMGVSSVRRIDDQFHMVIREAYWAEKVAEIEKEPVRYYRNLGIYQLIASYIHTAPMRQYAQNYFAPLFEEEEKDGELMHTAVEYVLAKGDAMETARRLYCHKNTIRYRIGKLQEKLDPDVNEKEFYQNLAIAVKIYLLANEKKEK